VQLRTYPADKVQNGATFDFDGGLFTYGENFGAIHARDPAIAYFFKARAHNSLGPFTDCCWSDEVEISSVSTDRPPEPRSLVVSAEGPRFFTIAFNTPNATVNSYGSVASFQVQFKCHTPPCPEGTPFSLSLDAPSDGCAAAVPPGADGYDRTCTMLVSDANIQPNSLYFVAMRSISAASNTLSIESGQVSLQTGFGAPEPPTTGLRVFNYTTSGFIVAFDPAEDNGVVLEPYRLELTFTAEARRRRQLSTRSVMIPVGPAPSHTFNDLPSGANCSIAVYAVNAQGDSVPAEFPGHYFTHHEPRVGNVPATVGSPLQGLPTTSTLHIEWVPPFDFGSPISSYELVVDGTPVIIAGTPPSTEYVYAGLDPGTRHTFSIAATNAIGQGPFSTLAPFDTSDAVPLAPPEPTITCYETPTIFCRAMLTETLVPGVIDVASLIYQFEESSPQGIYTTNITVGGTCSNAGTLTPCSWAAGIARVRQTTLNYQFRVRAWNAMGWGEWSSTATIENSLVGRPPTPENVNITSVEAKRIGVTFAVDDGGSLTTANATFTVAALTQAVGAVGVAATTAANSPNILLSNADYCTPDGGTGFLCTYLLGGADTVGALSPDTTYRVTAIVTNTMGSSGAGEAAATTPRAPPDAPANLRVTNATSFALTYAWSAPVRPQDNLANGYALTGYVLSMQGTDPQGTVFSRQELLTTAGVRVNTLTTALGASDLGGDCAVLAGFAPANLSSVIEYEVTGLPSATPFRVNLIGCNALSAPVATVESACVRFCAGGCTVAEDALESCNSQLQPPTHTTGVPPRPGNVANLEVDTLLDERINTLFLTWENPIFDNGYPLLETELRINGESGQTVVLTPNDTEFNITNMPAATQFSTEVRWRNAEGWGEWSNLAWMTTLPTRPERPPAPTCGGESPDGSVVTTTERLVVNVKQTNSSNGQPVTHYFVELMLAPTEGIHAGTIVFNETRESDLDGRIFGLKSSDLRLPPGVPLDAGTRFHARSKALNSLGWSGWSPVSDSCAVAAHEFPIWTIIIILAAVLLGLGLCIFLMWKANLGKILSPKLRRKQHREIISDFVSSDMTPMEEHDPELVINPIFVHKMKREKERQRKQKVKGTGTGKSGGLARLGINLAAKQPEKVDPKKLDMMGVDRYLEKEKGIVDASKQMTAYEREMQQKKLTKAGKAAATKSNLVSELNKKDEIQRARDDARNAVKAGGDARKAAEAKLAEEEEFDPMAASYGARGKSGKGGYTAAL